jgi:hypothetical protein
MDLMIPPGWFFHVHRSAFQVVPAGVAFRDLDYFYGGISIQLVEPRPRDVETGNHERIRRLMARRVPEGVPELVNVEIDDKTLYGYGWTDGLGWIESFFFETDQIIEIQASSSFAKEGPDRTTVIQLAQTSIRWRRVPQPTP